MAKKSVVDYVKSMLQKGYPVSSIRNVMLKYGYTSQDVDEAINEAYHPTIRHEIHLGPTTVFVIMFSLVALIGAGLYVYYPPKGPAQLLDINLEPVTTTAKPGQNVVFIKELANLGSSSRYDVTITQEILEPKTSRVIVNKTETRAIETFGSTKTQMLVPEGTKPGDYILKAIAEYGTKRAAATLPVKVIPSDSVPPGPIMPQETCSDGIKNQDEEGTDCGGTCMPCKKEKPECDDSNPCTEDTAENEKCQSKPITPCCGNGICEEKEACAIDCKKPESGIARTESLEEIKELAKSDPQKAMQQCSQIDVPDLKDSCISGIGEVQLNRNYCLQVKGARAKDICYSNIAKASKDSSICSDISADGIRDSCYMTFALEDDDYSVCGSITNKQLRYSCEYMRQMHESSQQ